MRILTLDQLIKARACEEQTKLFEATFGKSVAVTEALAAALAHEFDFEWAAQNFLSDAAEAEYAKVRDAACAEYRKVCGRALAEYGKVWDAAWPERKKVCATTFAKLYNSDKGK